MPNYRRAHQGPTFFFTVVTHRRQPLLCEPSVRQILRTVTLELRAQRPFEIDAWVLLPDHMHCIWTLPEGDLDYSARWGWLKKEVTKRIRMRPAIAGSARPSPWQKRFWEHRIRDTADYANHCDYIHFNPVRHRLVRQVSEWPWSTFHRFVSRGIYADTWGNGDVMIPDAVGHE